MAEQAWYRKRIKTGLYLSDDITWPYGAVVIVSKRWELRVWSVPPTRGRACGGGCFTQSPLLVLKTSL